MVDQVSKTWEMTGPDGEKVVLFTGLSDREGLFGRAYYYYRLEIDGKVVFEGEDYGASSVYMDEDGWSDALPAKAVFDLMGFLILKPGDVEDEYFDNYTEEQLAFAESGLADEITLAYDRAETLKSEASELVVDLSAMGLPCDGPRFSFGNDGWLSADIDCDGTGVSYDGFDYEEDMTTWTVSRNGRNAKSVPMTNVPMVVRRMAA